MMQGGVIMKKIDRKVTVGMSEELYEKLKKLAEEEFRTVPNCIRHILREHMEKKLKCLGDE